VNSYLAVGIQLGPLGISLLSERWDGFTWTTVPTPQRAGVLFSFLSQVSCSSSTDCYAVGSTFGDSPFGGETPLVEHWDGTRWQIVTLPAADGASLSSVSCNSLTRCMAVGAKTATDTFDQKPFAERWTGARWEVLPVPVPSGSQSAALSGVTCTNKNNCYAVGYSDNKTLIEHWDGIKWSVVASPNASFALSNSLRGVACTSPTTCYAVGNLVQPGTGVSQTIVAQRI
jgi:hypothetical protein